MPAKKERNIILAISVITILLHLFSNAFANYGIFRDEFYYLACSNRLDLGYVDQPPFSIYILAIIKFIFGNSIFAIRFLPAILHGAIVYLAGLMSLKMGGGKTAITISCIAVALAPEILGNHTIYSMNSFDFLFWSLTAFILILIIQNENKNLPQRSKGKQILA